MTFHGHLTGVYAAAVTPLNSSYQPVLQDLPILLDFLASRGCHGALLLGTTGEGPSFAPDERLEIWRASLSVRQERPDFRLLAGTGTPSLEETIQLTKSAFDLGFDGVVVLPPYYFRSASEEGLFRWFKEVLYRAVPSDGALFGYHIPAISGVPLSLDLLARLKDLSPERFAGIKDSSSDREHARRLGDRFHDELLILNGNDSLFGEALAHHAGGCITAMANLVSPYLRLVWEAHIRGEEESQTQQNLEAARQIFNKYPPAPPLIKAIMANVYDFPLWSVRPPLLPLAEELLDHAIADYRALPEAG